MMPNTSKQSTPPIALPDALYKAVSLFNQGEYFECHEVIEVELWQPLSTEDELKLFYQGFLQIAVAFHHRKANNAHGAKTLLQKGLSKLQTYEAHPTINQWWNFKAWLNTLTEQPMKPSTTIIELYS